VENVLKFNVDVNTATGIASINGLNGAVGNVGTTAVKTGKSLTEAFSNDMIASVSHLTNIYGSLSGALSSVTSTVGEFIAASNKSALALAGLGEVSKAYGQSVDQANQYAKALTSDGLMQLSSSAQSLKFLMSSGFNISEAMQMATAMKDIGAFNNVVGNLDQAMVDASKGIKTGSIELIENIGLTQRLSAVMKAANIDASNGIDITNNAAQRQVVFNMVMAEGNKFQGNAARLAKESMGAYAQLDNSVTVLKSGIGDVLNVGFVPLAKIITTITRGLTKDLIPLTIAVAGGLTLYMVPAIITTTTALYAQGVALNVATGGMSSLAMFMTAAVVGVTSYEMATRDSTTAQDKNTEALKKAKEEQEKLTAARQAYIDGETDFVDRVKDAQKQVMGEDEKKIAEAKAFWVKTIKLNEEGQQRINYETMSVTRKYSKEFLEAKQQERDALNKLETDAANKLWQIIDEIDAKKAKANADKAKDRELDALKKVKTKPMELSFRTIETKQTINEAPPELKLPETFNSKEEYLQHLKEMQKAGQVFTKSEQEVFDNSFEFVSAHVNDSGKLIDGYYRKRKTDESKFANDMKSISLSALSGMQSEIDNIFNYKRKRSNEEYALDKKEADLNYKQSIKRIDDELKAEKKGSDKYEKLMIEKQKLDADFSKANKERKGQEELDNMSSADRAAAVVKAGMKSAISAVAAMSAAKTFEGALTAFPGPPGWIIAPIAAAGVYTAVSAFGGMFADGGQVQSGILKGNSHSRGGILIEAEGGEHITKKSRVSELGVGFFDFINTAPLTEVKKMISAVSIPSYQSKERMVYAEGGLVNRGFPVIVSGGGFSEAKLDKMIALLESNNMINYKKQPSQVTIVQKFIDPKIVAKSANKGNETIVAKRRI